MLKNLFLTKNQKLVRKWEGEHEQIVVLAHKVIGEYTKNNHKKAKKHLKELNSVAVDHLMNEDITFYKMLRDQKRLTPMAETQIKEFVKSFKGTKTALMNFLATYTKEEMPLDETFFNTFNEIVEILGQRIEYEEKNLYSLLYRRR